MWGLLAGLYLFVSLYRLSTGVLAEDLARAFGATATALGSLHAAFFYVYAPLQLVAGVLADRYGPRVTASVGAVAMHGGALLFAASPVFAAAFAGRLLMGLGASVIFIATLRFCANWYRADEFATVSGLTIAVSGLGGIVATYPLALAVTAVGWRVAVAALALVGLAIAAGAYLGVRNEPDDPAVFGAPEAHGTTSMADVIDNLRRVLGSLQTWNIGAIYFVATGVNITVFGLWGVPYLVQIHGLSVPDAAAITLLGSLGLATGPPAVGRLSDRLESRVPLMVVAGVVFVASYAAIAVTGDPPLAVVALAFFGAGFLIGGYALGLTVMKESHRAAASGTATGAVNTAGFLGAAVFPTAMGALLDAEWTGETVAGSRVYTLAGYRAGFGVATAAGLFALAMTLVLYWRRRNGHGSDASRPPQ